jgi:hypothetical protein
MMLIWHASLATTCDNTVVVSGAQTLLRHSPTLLLLDDAWLSWPCCHHL